MCASRCKRESRGRSHLSAMPVCRCAQSAGVVEAPALNSKPMRVCPRSIRRSISAPACVRKKWKAPPERCSRRSGHPGPAGRQGIRAQYYPLASEHRSVGPLSGPTSLHVSRRVVEGVPESASLTHALHPKQLAAVCHYPMAPSRSREAVTITSGISSSVTDAGSAFTLAGVAQFG